jgi:hypothetical protein
VEGGGVAVGFTSCSDAEPAATCPSRSCVNVPY